MGKILKPFETFYIFQMFFCKPATCKITGKYEFFTSENYRYIDGSEIIDSFGGTIDISPITTGNVAQLIHLINIK